jgi:hypothetical protein
MRLALHYLRRSLASHFTEDEVIGSEDVVAFGLGDNEVGFTLVDDELMR